MELGKKVVKSMIHSSYRFGLSILQTGVV